MEKKCVITAMVCIPFNGLSDEEISRNMGSVVSYIRTEILKRWNEDKDTDVNTVEVYFNHNHISYQRPSIRYEERPEDYRLMCLGNGISNIMTDCDVVILGPGWQNSSGCLIEAMSALFYNKHIIALEHADSGYHIIDSDRFDTMLMDGIERKVKNVE